MRRTRAATVAGLLALGIGFAACGGDGDSESSVPDGAVAVVGDREISEEAFDERVAALRRAQPKPNAEQRRDLAESAAARKQVTAQLQGQALSLLLMAEALEQEAEKRGVAAATSEARERWSAVAGRQFPNERALRRFLGGQTEAEVIEQLRLQLLAERIHEQVAEEAGGGRQGQRAVKRFQTEFRKRWQGETACREDLNAAGCPPPKQQE